MKTEQQADGAKLKNFTPLLDDLVQKFGIVTASVWGRVWRYAQQENHVCQASHETIAGELGLSLRTVVRHIHILTKAGYLKDHTPDIKNVPHTYSVTQKARILITVEGVTESHMKKQLKKQVLHAQKRTSIQSRSLYLRWQEWTSQRIKRGYSKRQRNTTQRVTMSE